MMELTCQSSFPLNRYHGLRQGVIITYVYISGEIGFLKFTLRSLIKYGVGPVNFHGPALAVCLDRGGTHCDLCSGFKLSPGSYRGVWAICNFVAVWIRYSSNEHIQLIRGSLKCLCALADWC